MSSPVGPTSGAIHQRNSASLPVNNRREGFAPATIEAVSQGLLF
jgi:hypothetical protein